MSNTLFQILAVLRGGPQDAPGILDALRRLGDDDDVPSIPAFYRHVRSAVDAGWLVIDGVSEDGEGPGRPRQRYALSPQGREALEARAATLHRFTRLALGPVDGGSAG